jgi:acyl-CoA thioester hydrolase
MIRRVTASAPAAPLRTTVDVEVRYVETDQMGHVHHANYIAWFELARTRLCVDTGWPYPRVEAMGFLLIVTGVEVRYRQPAHYGDVVAVTTWIDRLVTRLMRFGYEVRCGDRLLATGATEHVWVDRASRRPCRMPEELREPFSRAAGIALEA